MKNSPIQTLSNNRLDDEKNAFSPSSLGPGSEHQLLGAVLEGHHTEAPLYAPEGT
jgi:hypothetical protein